MDVIIIFVAFLGLVDSLDYILMKDTEASHSESHLLCQSQGLQMAIIRTHAHLLKLQQYIASIGGADEDMHTGMKWDHLNQRFMWPDNTMVNWAIWRTPASPAEPNCMEGYQSCGSSIQNCVRITTSYQFSTTSCNGEYDTLCSYEEESTTKADPDPATTVRDFITTTIPVTTADITTSIITSSSTTSTEVTSVPTTNPTTAKTSVVATVRNLSGIPRFTSSTNIYLANSEEITVNTMGPGSTFDDITTTGTTRNVHTSEEITVNTMGQGSTFDDITTTGMTRIVHTSTSLAPSSGNSGNTSQGATCPYPIDGNYPSDMSCTCYLEIANYRRHKWTQLLQENITSDKLQQIVKADYEINIKPYIDMDKTSLSTYRRAKKSVSDDRTSSESMGFLSIALISLPVVLGLTIDLINAFQ